MDNETLKKVFIQSHEMIVSDVDLDSVIDTLMSKAIITGEEFCELRKEKNAIDRRRDSMSLLYASSNPDTFLQFHQVLRDKFPEIAKKIDGQLTSQPTDGKFLLAAYNYI